MKSKVVLGALLMIMSLSVSVWAAPAAVSSLKFKDTEIATVLKAIEKKAELEGKKITIVTTPEVFGLVTVDLENVDWKTAFKVILKMNDLGYLQDGNILTVSSLTKIQEDQKKEDDALFASGGMKIEAFKLKHIEAADAAKLIQPFLSKDGKAAVLDAVNKMGWGFSASTSGLISVGDGSSTGGNYQTPAQPQSTTKMTRTKLLAVSDTPAIVRQIAKLLEEVDIAPKQVLIRAILLEVNQNKVFDLGIDWGTPTTTPGSGSIGNNFTLGAGSRFPIKPTAFTPSESGMTAENSGFEFNFSKVAGTQFEVVLHALQEDEDTNTLSTPTILTMDNREASILVGQQYPIIGTDSSTTTSDYVVGGNLDYYQNIGIQLRVVPQICGENEELVNLIVHPTVSSYSETVKINGSSANTVIAEYPIINTREAETQMVVTDGETVVLGGLLSDAKTKELAGVPFLSDIPLLGKIFDRETKNSAKTDLLIFLTVRIVKPSTILPADVLDRTKIDAKAKI